MESEDNKTDFSQSEGEENTLNPAGRAVIALLLGISIILLLNILNRGGWFALLSAFFGILLYSVLVLWQWLREQRRGHQKPHSCPVGDGPEAQRAAMSALYRGFLIYGLQAIAGVVGLLLLPDQQSPVFALISGILGFLFCKGLFTVGMFAVVAFIARREHLFPSKSS